MTAAMSSDDPAKHWKTYATPAETADLEGLEKNAADLDERRHKLSAALRLIRDRCIARRRYEAEAKAKGQS